MRGVSGYLALSLAVMFCLLPSCRHSRVIGPSAMSDIYAEMFLADQWVNDNPEQRRTVDTTRFYEAIFAKHGYSLADYDASVNYYLSHPEKYTRILEQSIAKLRATQKSLESFREKVEKQNAILEGLGYLHLPVFSPDSMGRDTALLWTFSRDTCRLRDSLIRDSLIRDSLIRDSLIRDSLFRDSLVRKAAALKPLSRTKLIKKEKL